jgi:hypothetical protein
MRKRLIITFLFVLLVSSFTSLAAQNKIFIWNNDRGECPQEYPEIGRWESGVSIVVWQDKRRGDNDIWGQIIDDDGQKIGENFLVNRDMKDGNQILASVGCFKSRTFCVIIWQSDHDGQWDLYGQIYSDKGEKMSETFLVNNLRELDQVKGRVEVCGGQYFNVCWEDERKYGEVGWDIYARTFETNGESVNPLTDDFLVNKQQEKDQLNPDISIVDQAKAEFFLCYAWQDSSRGTADISLRRFYLDGTPFDERDTLVVDKDIAPECESRYPTIGADILGNMIVSWEDNRQRRAQYTVYYQVIDGDLNFKGKNTPVTTGATYSQVRTSVACIQQDEGSIIWQDYRRGVWDIFGQRVDLVEGANVGDNFNVNDTTGSTSDHIYTVIDRDKATRKYHSCAWMDNRNPEGGGDIYFRALDEVGKPIMDEIEMSKLFGVQALYDDDEDYDLSSTPNWNEDPRKDSEYDYESAMAVMDMLQENNIDNYWQITVCETLPVRDRGRASLTDYDAVIIDLGWRHGGTRAGGITQAERDELVSYIDGGDPIIIAGNDFGYHYDTTALYDRFHINYEGDGNVWTTGNIEWLNGHNDRFTKGMKFEFRYQDTCDNYVDRTSLSGSGTIDSIFTATNPQKVYFLCGGAYSFAWKGRAHGKTCNLPFSLSGLIDGTHPNTNIELTRRLMAFVGQQVAPEPITTLEADSTSTEGIITLDWTAPLNQFVVSPDSAHGYILKFVPCSLSLPDSGKMQTDDEFNSAITYYQEWEPKEGGESESKTLRGLPPGDSLIFAIKAYDIDAGNIMNSTLGDEPMVKVTGDTLTYHSVVIGESGGYVNDFIAQERMGVRESDTLYFTWDADELFVGYALNDWQSSGGDMFIYFDFESGGADSTFPENSGTRNRLPVDFRADYCFRVGDYSDYGLYQDNGAGDWDKTSISYTGDFSEDNIVNNREFTELSIPFSDIGYNPSGPFNFLVTCQNETDNNLWNAFPVENAIDVKTVDLYYYYHFDNLGMGVCPGDATTLDIQLSSLIANSTLKGVKIEWRTECENEIYQWIVEKKKGGSFSEIGRVKGSGNSQSPRTYTFLDSDVVRGCFYTYRLYSLSNSGVKICRGIITVTFSPVYPEVVNLYSIIPNPGRSRARVSFVVPRYSFVSMKIYDISGRVVKKMLDEFKDPGIYETDISLTRLPQGIYFLELQCMGRRIKRKITVVR